MSVRFQVESRGAGPVAGMAVVRRAAERVRLRCRGATHSRHMRARCGACAGCEAHACAGRGRAHGGGAGGDAKMRRSGGASPFVRRLSGVLHGADGGAATAEFAVVLPAVIAMVVLLLCLTRTVSVTMTCQQAASEAVRAMVVAGGERDPVPVAQAVAGAGASASVTRSGELVSVSVQCPVIPDPFGVLPTRVRAEVKGVVS